jgi:hypothetical protein
MCDSSKYIRKDYSDFSADRERLCGIGYEWVKLDSSGNKIWRTCYSFFLVLVQEDTRAAPGHPFERVKKE